MPTQLTSSNQIGPLPLPNLKYNGNTQIKVQSISKVKKKENFGSHNSITVLYVAPLVSYMYVAH